MWFKKLLSALFGEGIEKEQYKSDLLNASDFRIVHKKAPNYTNTEIWDWYYPEFYSMRWQPFREDAWTIGDGIPTFRVVNFIRLDKAQKFLEDQKQLIAFKKGELNKVEIV